MNQLHVHATAELNRWQKLLHWFGKAWRKPLINLTDYVVVCEWWNDTKKLTIYFTGGKVEYVKVWSPHIVDGMEVGELEDHYDILPLWEWLYIN